MDKVGIEEANLKLFGGFTGCRDGVLYVGGAPYFKRMAFFGYNHWMTADETKSFGNFMAQPVEQVGTVRDSYTQAGFNGGVYSVRQFMWPFTAEHLNECVRRGRQTGQKVTLAFWVTVGPKTSEKYDFHWITEDGEKVPFGEIMGIYHDAKLYAKAYREELEPLFDAIRDNPDIIGYQIGGERWPYDMERVGKEVSYDAYSLGRFREYLQKRFSLAEISQRYGGRDDFYSSFAEVSAPITKAPLDFARRELVNHGVAQWDWYCFRKTIAIECWTEIIAMVQELDGRGRPCHFEHGHGPYNSMGFLPFEEFCAKAENFSVGNGEFRWDLTDTLISMSQEKCCGKGPWINNELNAGTACMHLNAADIRRELWGHIALGVAGYNIWTFFNLLGAKSEFTDDAYYEPHLPENFPPKYYEIKHANEMLESLGTVLAGSVAPPTPLKIMLLDDSVYRYKFTHSYYPEATGVCQTCVAHGLADRFSLITEYHVENDLRDARVIIAPRTPRITARRAAKLAEFVKAGGTLILMSPCGRIDDFERAYDVYPYHPQLRAACGVDVRDLSAAEVAMAPVTILAGEREYHIDVITSLTVPKDSRAEILLAHEGRPVITRNRYGAGQCITVAGQFCLLDYEDDTGRLLAELIADGGVRAPASIRENGRTDTGIFLGRRVHPEGTMLTLIENADRRHHARVTLDAGVMNLKGDEEWFVHDLFGTEIHSLSAADGWSFEVDFEPVEVRNFFITRVPKIDHLIPSEKRLMVRRAPEAIIYRKAADELPWKVGSTAWEQLAFKRSLIIRAEDVGPQSPCDLGNGYLALDIAPYCRDSVGVMMKDIDTSSFINHGAYHEQKISLDKLPLQPGLNRLGGIPAWVCGSYMVCDYEIRGIPVGCEVAGFHFFHGGHLQGQDSSLGYYRVHYADGTIAKVPIIYGVTLRDFASGKWDRIQGWPAKTVDVWTNGRTGIHEKRLTRYDWPNPYTEKKVRCLDVVTTRNLTKHHNLKFAVWGITIQSMVSEG